MERWAEFVLRHRKWVVVFWIAMMVGGGAVVQKVNDRLTIDFNLPGEPGTEAAALIVKNFQAGGTTSPELVTITVKDGRVDDPSNKAAIHAAFTKLASDLKGIDGKTLPVRVVDQVDANDDKAFQTKNGETAF